MTYVSTTPFGQRPVTTGLLKSVEAAYAQPNVPHIDKWEVFRELCTARVAFGLTDRDLTVLNALLSFHSDKMLSDNASLVVFPSNRALSERAHGMPESTLRRHLAALVRSGVILRNDSPNGKRYAARDGEGEVTRAFGFDLRPLLSRSMDITSAAKAALEAQERIKRLRENITLMKRDALKLAEYGASAGLKGDWEAQLVALMDIHRRTRRKLDFEALEELSKDVENLLNAVTRMMSATEEMSGSDIQFERHFQTSNKDTSVSEPCLKKGRAGGDCLDIETVDHSEQPVRNTTGLSAEPPRIPLALVLKACPDIVPYAKDSIRHWHELLDVAQLVRGMMGISQSAWEDAKLSMGPENASMVLAGILQRVHEINSPGGYLRSLSAKAKDDKFSPAPMIMALLNRGAIA